MNDKVKIESDVGVTTVRVDPLAVVSELSRSRYAGANCILFGGSAAQGTHNESSDIDLVVLFNRLPNASRESFTDSGWLIDAQLHDAETLNYVLTSDARFGSAILANFILEAKPIPNESRLQREIAAIAKTIVDAGPPKTDLSGSRYTISNMLSDLSQSKDKHELMATATELYKVLALHVFREKGQWLVSRKMIPRSLKAIDEQLEQDFSNAFQACFADQNPALVIALTKRLIPELAGSTNFHFNWTYPAQQRLKIRRP